VEINGILHQLQAAVPAAEVRPVRQIIEGEARCWAKLGRRCWPRRADYSNRGAVRALDADGWVLTGGATFAILKALGASDRMLNGFFAAEAAALGATGL